MEDPMEDTAMGENSTATETKLIPIYVMGKRYEVPEGFTIMKALEYAGYKYIRGCGCRGGICGACGTIYRKPGDYKIYTALACQTTVEPNMYLAQLPFYPANHAACNYAELTGVPEDIYKLYPELFRCVACNACSKICPMDVPVMDVIAYIKRGDIEKAAFEAFDCIQCGLCASRCFAEAPQYHIMQLARRLYGGKLAPKAEHNAEAAQAVKVERKYEPMLKELMNMSIDELKKVYTERQIEPETAGDDWKPEDARFLLEEE